MDWKEINKPRFFILLTATVGFVYGTKMLNKTFLPGLENRPGFDIYDPVLAALPAKDVSDWIFILMYSMTAVGVILIGRDPRQLLRFLLSSGIMYLFRFVCILLIPLNAPPDLVVLRDPIVDILKFHSVFLRRDLFFSGHFASVFLIFLAVGKNWYRWIFLFFGFVVGYLILVQHIHYSYDILGAVVFSYLSFYLAGRVADVFLKYFN